MYLFVLFLCGMLQAGLYFAFYIISEIVLVAVIWNIDKRKENGNSASLGKYVYKLVLGRVCSTVVWCVIFSITNNLFTPKAENGWELLDYWFPPDVLHLYNPYWHLIIVLAVCLAFTLVTFQIYVLKKKRFLYYTTIVITTLIMFCIITRAGLPLYWH